MDAWGLSDTGKVRKQNQDYYNLIPFGPDCLLAIVCDGMGGAKSGNVASRLAAEVFIEELKRGYRPGMTQDQADYLLRTAVSIANTAVYENAQLNPDMKGSTLVQTIYFEDPNNLFGYALQWVVDKKNKMLYGYGNTTKDKDLEGNRHRVIKFALPKLSDSDANGMVVLKESDALENYVLEDNGLSFATIGQGLCIWKDRLMMPTGLGTEQYPSYLFVWDLKNKRPVEVLDMSIGTTGELEDLAHFKGKKYLVQGQDGLFLMKYKK